MYEEIIPIPGPNHTYIMKHQPNTEGAIGYTKSVTNPPQDLVLNKEPLPPFGG